MRMLSFGSPSGRRDRMTAFIGRREFITLLGGVSGIAIAVAIFAGNGNFGSPQAFSAGFAPAIGIAAVLSLLGAVAGMWQPARRTAALAQVRASA
jgi:hypothetical protein